MPEVPICMYCQNIIDTDKESYAVPNKFDESGQARPAREWQYAHAQCYQKEISKTPKKKSS